MKKDRCHDHEVAEVRRRILSLSWSRRIRSHDSKHLIKIEHEKYETYAYIVMEVEEK